MSVDRIIAASVHIASSWDAV